MITDNIEVLQSLVYTSPNGIVIVDAATLLIEMVNDAFIEISGKPYETLYQRHLWEAFKEVAHIYRPMMEQVIKEGRPVKGDDEPLTLVRNGREETFFINFMYTPLTGKEGNVTHVAIWVLENTGKVKERQTIQNQNEELENEVARRTRALYESEANLQLAVSSAGLAAWTLDLNTLEVYLSEQYRLMFGLPLQGDLSLEHIIQLTEPADVPLLNSAINNAITKRENVNLQYRIKHGITGEQKWIKGVGKVITDAEGKPLSIIGMNMDITEQVAAFEKVQALNEELAAANEELTAANEILHSTQQDLQSALQEAEESGAKLYSMIHSSTVAMQLLRGVNLVFEEMNAPMLAIAGKPANELIGKPMLEVYPELAGSSFFTAIEHTYNTGEVTHFTELPVAYYKGGVMYQGYFNVSYAPMRENGKITGIMQTSIEVTDSINARRKIETAEESLRVAIDAGQLGTFSFNTQTGELIHNLRLKELFGFNADDEVTVEGCLAQVRDDYRARVADTFERATTAGEKAEIDFPVIGNRDGKLRWLRNVGTVKESNKAEWIYSGVILDITEQKIDDERKNDFIGMVSHELKTPLTSLSAYMQMVNNIATAKGDVNVSAMLEKANKQVTRMNGLINGFLNVSRLESGKIQIDKHPFDMAILMKELEDELRSVNLTHKIVFAPVEDVMVSADREKISQVLHNLISNAFKYSPKGSDVTITCIDINHNVQVSVHDNGIGILPQDQEKLFDRYYRVESNLSKTISGFGIGLYLTAEIIRLHDGRIWVESEPGNGSTFYFSLPLA